MEGCSQHCHQMTQGGGGLVNQNDTCHFLNLNSLQKSLKTIFSVKYKLSRHTGARGGGSEPNDMWGRGWPKMCHVLLKY